MLLISLSNNIKTVNKKLQVGHHLS